MSFHASLSQKPNKTEIVISGPIDEEASLPSVGADCRVLEVHLGAVSSVNSIGIRKWLLWMQDLTSLKIPISFFGVPRCVVLQMNMVQGFLPDSARVESFVVPMYCEKCERDTKLVATRTIIPTPEALSKIDLASVRKEICQKQDCQLEIDANEKYLQFLRPKKSK